MIYVDTNVLIDALRGYGPAVQFLQQSSQTDMVGCSQVCEVELLVGAPSAALRRPVDKLVRNLTVITPSESDFRDAVDLFRKTSLSHGVEFFDCLIAATALRLGLAVYSKNIKHLSAIPGVSVVQPYP